ncbi:Peroxisomal multifunctional enzyme type 2, partial [Fragariocoptes setiger]
MVQAAQQLRFDDRTAIVTGAGGGLGREYALLLAARGASIVVNDLGGSRSGETDSGSADLRRAADKVVDEIKNSGGKAVANYDSVENGGAIVKSAIDTFGRVDIVINNAGILRDKSLLKMTDQDFDLVQQVHLRGSFMVTKAAWPYMREQKYGRIIMTGSTAGLYGNFGQTNYAAAKMGLVGLSNTLAVEGAKYNIHSSVIVPVAASRLTEDVIPQDLLERLKPAYVAPVVAWLCHEQCQNSGGIFEAAGGWVGQYRLHRAQGVAYRSLEEISPEAIKNDWSDITSMKDAKYINNITEQMGKLLAALESKEDKSKL